MKKLVILLIVTVLFSGCAYLDTVSITSLPKNRTQKVSTEASKWIILGFNFDNDYIDNLASNLAEQCPTGVVKGVLTKHESILYFLASKEIVNVTGYCVKR